jgi:peptidoglycan/xylan/chitin deacetylase (PgdA/CDA1 family)
MRGTAIEPTTRSVPVLMYHSISAGPGPTCIAPEVFRQQMAILEETGYRVVSLRNVLGWMRCGRALPGRCVALTFDDGFEDFAAIAHEELRRRRWPATVFVPSGHVGGSDGWDRPSPSGHRRLMDWSTIAGLAAEGVEFGGHGVGHRDLTRVRGTDLEAEVLGSKRAIEDRTGREVACFAPPFGRSDDEVARYVRRHYLMAVGTRLARADRDDDPYDVPRIEMWYFREPRRWRAFLRGEAEGYFLARQFLRGARRLAAAIAPARPTAPGSVSSTTT